MTLSSAPSSVSCLCLILNTHWLLAALYGQRPNGIFLSDASPRTSSVRFQVPLPLLQEAKTNQCLGARSMDQGGLRTWQQHHQPLFCF